MLFGYPIEATLNNWLHDCLFEAVRNIHEAVNLGQRYPGWPQILPGAHRSKLRSRRGLRDRFEAYDRAIRTLEKPDRDAVFEALEGVNRISDVLSGQYDCLAVDGLPEVVRDPVDSLFGFAFTLLTELDVRDQQYAVIYAATPEHMCPFCGTEYFDAPGAAREALDHYLTKSRYPFAAANLRNLVPMGYKCNSSYKLARDIIRRGDGSRRVAFDPYNHTGISIRLDDSDPFGGVTEYTPNWEIRFDPETAAVPTWDEVFSVRERYCRDHLNPSFPSWLGLFGKWVRNAELQIETDEALVDAIQRYETFWTESGFQDRAFLKAAVFRMLRRHCESGHRRLIDHLRNLVAISAPAPPVPM